MFLDGAFSWEARMRNALLFERTIEWDNPKRARYADLSVFSSAEGGFMAFIRAENSMETWNTGSWLHAAGGKKEDISAKMLITLTL